MLSHTRSMVAAAAYAVIFGQKVAGIHDHADGRDLPIAAEARGTQIQAYDGDRSARFGGDLPELYDDGDRAFISLSIDGLTAQGYDRNTSSHYALIATDRMVQLFDHSANDWFAFSIQI